MPYISEEKREVFDLNIDAIVRSLSYFTTEEDMEGSLNYIISRILSGAYNIGNPRYYKINRIVGTLECVKQEFYRRIASDYEDKAIEKNGDIPEYGV